MTLKSVKINILLRLKLDYSKTVLDHMLGDLPFIALVFSANFTKFAVKCKQTAEKTNLLDICGSYGCGHWLQ